MAERFERLFSLPAPAYSEGADALLEAGMLLRDKSSGRVLIQLKFRNVSRKSIRALRVGIAAYDSFGNRLADIPEYQYTDLFVAPGNDFASDKAILLPDALTRSFAITYIDIAFIHGEKSTVTMPMQPLPTPRSLSGVLPSLAEQEFRLCTCDAAKFLPEESTGLWLCPCGRWNSGDCCSNCHLSKTQAFSVPDTEELLARAEARIAKEQRQKAEAEERQRKTAAAAKEKFHQKKQAAVKLSMRILAVIVLLTLLAAGAFFVYPRFLAPTEAAVPETPAAEQKTPEKGPSAGESLYDTQDTIRSSETHTEDFPLKTQSRSGLKTICAGGALTAAIKTDGTVLMEGYWATPSDWTNIAAVSSGSFCAGLRNDGTVVVCGSPWGGYWNTCDNWTDIVAISAGNYHLVGLRSDGTVVADGRNHEKQCNVSDWTDIVSIVASENCTAGLRNDGTVAVSGSFCEQSNADGWTDIVAISAGNYHLVGLRSDGTVVAVGTNSNGQCDVSDWTDIVAVSAGAYHTVGLRKDGSVVACGINNENQCNVSDWTDITEIIAAKRCTIGFHNDGTVVVAGNNYFLEANNWTNIVDIAAGDDHVVGLRSDGTLVTVGRGSYGQCNVDDWADIRLPETVSISVSSDLSTPVSTPTPTPTPIPTTKPTTFTNNYGSASTRCAYPGCTRNIVSSGDSNCCSVHSARCVYCKAYIDSDASICMDCITDAFSSAASKGSSSSGGAESFYCMGKGDTCPNKTYSAYDFYCASCDPDGDNREG